MSSAEDFQVQNIYRYSRKSYKKNRRNCQDESGTPREEQVEVAEPSRSDALPMDTAGVPGCSCDLDTEGDIANILHKKCAVVSLAKQQLQQLLEGTDRLLCDNTHHCKSVYDFVCICKDLLKNSNKAQCMLLLMIGVAFCVGLVVGAASCGAYLGRFNSPILNCIDHLFVQDSFASIQDSYRSIA